MKKIVRLIILLLFSVVQITFAQDRQITGKVINQTDNNPILGASVKVKGTTKASGLSVSQQSGKPGGDGATINIRGIGSVSAGTTPLILVDNVEMSLDAIDVNNIESISVLKDAASTAIFGSRAANGVILVKTKRGADGTTISYNNFVSWQDATNLPQRLTAVEHMELYNQALVNSGKAKAFTDQLIADYKSNPADNFNYRLDERYFD